MYKVVTRGCHPPPTLGSPDVHSFVEVRQVDLVFEPNLELHSSFNSQVQTLTISASKPGYSIWRGNAPSRIPSGRPSGGRNRVRGGRGHGDSYVYRASDPLYSVLNNTDSADTETICAARCSGRGTGSSH
jgi:hypothetical protein